ncbi:MAG: WG repeat-containing protein [Firmicutes bacterium]|nr:WG repeat-containing protein [Bacillota bacterium]
MEYNVVEKISINGYIISRERICGQDLKVKSYNLIRLNDFCLASEEWFDEYIVNELGECIIKIAKVIDLNGQKSHFKYGMINQTGYLIIDPIYDELTFNNEETVIAKLNNKYGYLDSLFGDNITPIIYDSVTSFKDGKAILIKDGKEEVFERIPDIIVIKK